MNSQAPETSFTNNNFSQSKSDQACTQANSMCDADPYKQKCVMNYYKRYVDGACNSRIGINIENIINFHQL